MPHSCHICGICVALVYSATLLWRSFLGSYENSFNYLSKITWFSYPYSRPKPIPKENFAKRLQNWPSVANYLLLKQLSDQKLNLTLKICKLKENEFHENETCQCIGWCVISHRKHSWKKSICQELFYKFDLWCLRIRFWRCEHTHGNAWQATRSKPIRIWRCECSQMWSL